MHTFLTTPRSLVAAAALLGALLFCSGGDVSAEKEFLLQGTVDCGRRSGARCEIDTRVRLWTADVSGVREQVVVDLSWVTGQLDRYDQDDLLCLDVRVQLDGTLQATGVSTTCGAPAPRRRPTEDTDERAAIAPAATATPTATPGPTGTLSPTGTPTDTPTPTSTPTNTPVVNLVTTKTDDRDPVPIDESATWTVTVRNTGTAPATGVTVRDRISREPGTTANILITNPNPLAQPGFTCTLTTEIDAVEFTCTGGTIAAGGTATLTYTFIAISPGIVTNTATADPGDAIEESDEGDNTATVTTTLIGGEEPAAPARSSDPGRPWLGAPRR